MPGVQRGRNLGTEDRGARAVLEWVRLRTLRRVHRLHRRVARLRVAPAVRGGRGGRSGDLLLLCGEWVIIQLFTVQPI